MRTGTSTSSTVGTTPGRVLALHIAPQSGAPTREVEQVVAVPGRGLEGDRYFDHPRHGTGRTCEVTLIEAEALEALEREHGVRLSAAESRRNITTRGVDLNALVGSTFFVGDVLLRGIKLCEPCLHLEQLTRPGVLRGLVHRGGLRAEILSEGVIATGAAVRHDVDQVSATPAGSAARR